MFYIYRLFSRIAAAFLVALSFPVAAEGKAPPPVRPALWKIADEDTTIYLFGTVHVLPPGIEWFDGKVAAAFDKSEELVTEIIEDDSGSTRTGMFQRAALPEGQTLRAMLSPEDRAKYEAALAQLGLPAPTLDRYEPWLAAIVLSVGPLAEAGFASSNGVEKTLELRARARSVARGALETPEFQLDLFDSLPIETQKTYLTQVVDQLPTIKQQIGDMVEAWKRGDADELARLMNSAEDDPGLMEALLTNRNRTWAGWVRERLKKPGTVFLAVGAGHLAGPGSLQDQLAAGGITAERVQ